MHWQEAVRQSSQGEAIRGGYRGKAFTVYFRQADGTALRLDDMGRRHLVHPGEVEGYDDWRPA